MKLTSEQARELYNQRKYISYKVHVVEDPTAAQSNVSSYKSYNYKYYRNITDKDTKSHGHQLCDFKEYVAPSTQNAGHPYYYSGYNNDIYSLINTKGETIYVTFKRYGGGEANKNYVEFHEFKSLMMEFTDGHAYYIGNLTESDDYFYLCIFINMDIFHDYYLKNYKLNKNIVSIISKYALNQYKITKLKSCSDEMEYKNISPNFKLELYDYQKQTINWMIRTENSDFKFLAPQSSFFKLADQTYIELINRRNDPLLSQYVFSEDHKSTKMVRCRGGILADIMGNGKTITTIALIYHNQPPTYPLLTSILEREVYISSKATLVICPVNIASQWESELHKCVDLGISGLRVLKIATKVQMNKYTLYDIVNADIIITTYDWLVHANHIGVGFIKKNRSNEFLTKQKMYIAKYGTNYNNYPDYCLLFLKYNRIIYDEFHEQIDSNSGQSNILYVIKNCLKAKYIWGISGTPLLENETIMNNIPNLLQIYDDNNDLYQLDAISQHEVYNRFVRRNTKINLPPISYHVININQTLQEKQLYDSSKSQQSETLMQLACYHNLSNMGIQSIDDVNKDQEKILFKQRNEMKEEIDEMQCNLKQIEQLLKSMNPKIKSIQELYYLVDSTHPKHNHKLVQLIQQTPTLQIQCENLRQYRKISKHLTSKSDELVNLNKCIDYYQTTTKAFNNGVFTCPITGETAGDGEVVITKYGHLFSKSAIDMLFECGDGKTINCPVTGNKLNLGDISIVSNKQTNTENLNSNQRLFGSKITTIIDEIKKTTTEKIIVFAKWDKLLHTIGYALDVNNIGNVYIKGSEATRNKAIDEFRNNPKIKVILLSSEYSASGVNLQVSHTVFIVHPFIGDQGQHYEAQAIRRAYRTGQKNPVNVTFFITNNTIESELWDKDRKFSYVNQTSHKTITLS